MHLEGQQILCQTAAVVIVAGTPTHQSQNGISESVTS